MFEAMLGSAPVRLIVPVTEKLIVSSPAPAAHSPADAPESVSLLADAIASRSVQRPSSEAASEAELTVMVAATTRACARADERTAMGEEAAVTRAAAASAQQSRRRFLTGQAILLGEVTGVGVAVVRAESRCGSFFRVLTLVWE